MDAVGSQGSCLHHARAALESSLKRLYMDFQRETRENEAEAQVEEEADDSNEEEGRGRKEAEGERRGS